MLPKEFPFPLHRSTTAIVSILNLFLTLKMGNCQASRATPTIVIKKVFCQLRDTVPHMKKKQHTQKAPDLLSSSANIENEENSGDNRTQVFFLSDP